MPPEQRTRVSRMIPRKLWRKPLSSLLKRFHIAVNGGYSVGSAYGARMLFDWRHSLDKKVAVELYEYTQINFLCACASRIQPRLFLDIGAHAALYSLIMKRRFPDLEVHAFEPDKTNLCQLYANLFVNNLTHDIQVHEHGVSDHSGTASFITSSEHSSRGTRRIATNGDVTIPVEPLDTVINARSQVIILKIDVEGHEHAVLKGAKKILSQNQCLLQLESTPEQFYKIKDHMINEGYKHLTTLSDHFFTNIDGFIPPPTLPPS